MQAQRHSFDWVDSEFSTLSFRDERLTNRFLLIARRMLASPSSTLNQALRSKAEVKGAYRMFANQHIDTDEILSSHQVELAKRIKKENIILSIQDTSLLVYNGHKKTEGLGELGRIHTSGDRGLFLHTCLAVAPDGKPFGIFSHQCWARDRPYEKTDCYTTRKIKRRRLEPDEKESFKWVQALEKTAKIATGSQARIITIADREGDYGLLMARAVELGGGFVIRSRADRVIFPERMKQSSLHDHLAASQSKGQIKIPVPNNDEGTTKVVEANIKFISFKMKMCGNIANFSDQKFLEMSAIEVSEVGPQRKNRLHWILLTSERIDDLMQAKEIIEWYKARWTIETYFKILKSGLKVEECRLATADRLFRFIALASIVGYRILYLSRIYRVNPNDSCDEILTENEWKVLRISTSRKCNIDVPPSIQEAVIMIAMLGGYQCRKADPPPGPIVIWRGLKALAERTQLYEILQSDPKNCGH